MKKHLITGLLIWIPLVITLWVLKLVVDALDQTLLLLPMALRTENWLGLHVPGMGVVMTLVIVLLTGLFATNLLGARLVHLWHHILHRIPVVNSIYSSVKQISDTLFSSSGQAFRKALLVQWPRDGMWTIAFLTGVPGGDLVNHLKGDYLGVYVPTTPNPTGGYFMLVARKDVIELDMSVDEALKYIISMGVVPPSGRADRKANNQ
ncbi:MAG: DUF502 domain-containing protein [Betaproteobacteria bacterium]|nr:DUF502 domain-containing protein [Betaproteobacteria bacterium]MSQ89151.1 DUF502 domain-containing protein [Betaproteobacteria bacterium]